jgi:O-antigen ligase/tetratricopeptide (TPR) repeat protein
MSEQTGTPANPGAGESPPGQPPVKRRRRIPASRAWRERPEIWYVIVGIGLVILAGGGTPVWARALVLIGIGGWLWKRPPTETPSRLFDAALLVLLLMMLLSSFAPAAYFGLPSWRTDAMSLGVVLPNTNAPAPWLSAEALMEMLAGVGIFYSWWGFRPDHESRKWALWGVAGLTTLLAFGLIVGCTFGVKYPLAEEARTFSYFPNRNQTALWFCIGGVVAFGMLLESMPRRKRAAAAIAGAMVLVCLLGLVFSLSRMALALFSVGCVLVVVVRFGRDAGNYLVRFLMPLGVLGISLLVFFQPATLKRFHVFGGDGDNREFRLELWADTLQLAKTQLVGTGLDQFEDVYPQYRERARTFQSVYHPDSDWVWLLGETGWGGVTAAAVAVGALAGVFVRRVSRESGPYRHLATVCAGLFLLHSLVDVPAHRFGTWLLVAWLLGLAAPEREPIRGLLPAWLFRVLGVVLVGVGVTWLLAVAGMPTQTTLIEDRAMAKSEDAITNGDADGAVTATEAVMRIRPMRWEPYYQQARAILTLNNDRDGALADFRRARFLEPNWAGLPYREGYLWAPYDSALAYAAWREAVQRDDNVAKGTWGAIAEMLPTLPNGQDYLSNLSKTKPEYRYEYLMAVAPARFAQEWTDDLTFDPQLGKFTPEQRQALVERWASIDGGAALDFVQSHPRVMPQGWLVQLRGLAQVGRFGDALKLARQYIPAAPLPDFPNSAMYDDDNDERLASMFRANSRDVVMGTVLLKRFLQEKELDKAYDVLSQMLEMKPPPPFVSWWRAEILDEQGREAEAWAALQPYLDYQRKVMAQPKNTIVLPDDVYLPKPVIKKK